MLRRQSHYLLNNHKAFIMSFLTHNNLLNNHKAFIMSFLTHNNDSLIKSGFHNCPQLPSTFSRIRSLSFNNGIICNVSNSSFGFRIRSCCSDSQNSFSNDQRAAHSYTVPHHQLVRDLETRLEDRTSSSNVNGNCNSSSSSANHGSYINGNGKALGFPPANYPLTSNLVVAVDVDEVLGNFVSALNRFIADRYSSNHSVSEYHVYEFFRIWKCSRDEADVRVHEFFKTPYFKSGIYPLPGAKKVLNKMSRVCKLSVVTSRQNVIKDHTIEWIEKHYPGVFEEIHFGNHFALHGESRPKSEICRDLGATVLIDDNPRYAIECAEVGIKVLLFNYENSYPWCKSDSVNHPLVTKVHNWEQVEQQLISLVS